jgi:hypothetical protein
MSIMEPFHNILSEIHNLSTAKGIFVVVCYSHFDKVDTNLCNPPRSRN